MTPMETRHYEAISRIDAEVKAIKDKMDERHENGKREHEEIKSTLDLILADVKMCPHLKINETEEKIDEAHRRIDAIFVTFVSVVLAYGGLITTIFFALRK